MKKKVAAPDRWFKSDFNFRDSGVPFWSINIYRSCFVFSCSILFIAKNRKCHLRFLRI